MSDRKKQNIDYSKDNIYDASKFMTRQGYDEYMKGYNKLQKLLNPVVNSDISTSDSQQILSTKLIQMQKVNPTSINEFIKQMNYLGNELDELLTGLDSQYMLLEYPRVDLS
jgi:hypothetical protein